MKKKNIQFNYENLLRIWIHIFVVEISLKYSYKYLEKYILYFYLWEEKYVNSRSKIELVP